jgi:hypothetical protein
MGHRLLGTNLAHCDRQQICGCSVDERYPQVRTANATG